MTRLLVLALGAALVGVACDEKKPSSETARSDAGAADKYATADPKLEKALKAVASSEAADKGPPPTGIFAPGIADQRHPRGAATKIDVVTDGGEPRIALQPSQGAAADAARSSSYGPAMLQVVLQLGRSPFAVDYGLSVGPAKKDDGGPDWLVADVKKAAPSKALGQVPPGLEKEIGSLEGTEIRIQLTPDGRESDLQTRMGKSAQADLDRLALSAAEALVFSTVPLPPKPVGLGAQWIAETRMPMSGLDVIAYRAYRVKNIDGDRLHLTVDVKAYAASKDVQLAGIPKGATLEQFDAQCQGEMELVRGETFARKSDVQQRAVLVFAGPGGAQPPSQPGQPPGNMIPAQIQMQATLVRGEDLRAAARRP
jgi:hypothetical protein